MFIQIKKIALLVLSHPFFSKITGVVVRIKFPKFLVRAFIKFYFIKHRKVNLSEIEFKWNEYASPLAFFTRRLKDGVRSIDMTKGSIVSPVDGEIASFGDIVDGKLYQVKDKAYSLKDFVGSDDCADFLNGSFVTIYLSPTDYHRIHQPLDAVLQKIIYFPGRLLPVNHFSLHHFKNVFSKNKRVSLFYSSKSPLGLMSLVGALNVGDIPITLDESFYKTAQKETSKSTKFFQKKYKDLKIEKGKEVGIFNLGSTVILIFRSNKVKLQTLTVGQKVKLGQVIAHEI